MKAPTNLGRLSSISFVRFVEGPQIIEQFLFYLQFETRKTGADIFAAVNTYFQEKYLLWINCFSICSDGAAAMTGHIKGFLSFAQKENSSLITTHCFLHREALMVKSTDGNRLEEDIKTVIHMISSNEMETF
jgi:hypothetical protein